MNEIEINGGPSNHVELAVSLDGMTLQVAAGAFQVGGEDFSLVEEQTYDVEGSDTEVTCVDAYLVQDASDDSVALLVDERAAGDGSYVFAVGSSPYRLLHALVTMRVPAGATDLENADVTVTKIAAGGDSPEEEPQE